jgi:integrase/recombinase XerD
MNYLQRFIDDCQARGLTKHTIETYRSNLKRFLDANREPENVRIVNLVAFLGSLRARRLRNSTISGYFYAISAFFSDLEYYELIPKNLVHGFAQRHLRRLRDPNEETNTRQCISIQDMTLVVSAAHDIRETAILMTLAKTGMRRGELHDLRAEDIDFKRGVLRIPPKPKRSVNKAYIDTELAAVLVEYLAWRKKRTRSEWLWITKRGGRVHKDYYAGVIARIGSDLGLHDPKGALCDKLTPHCFRHWFTTNLRRAGMNIEIIKYLRGDRRRSEAWQMYDHIDPEEARQEYMLCIPRILTLTGVPCVKGAPVTKGG